MDKHIEHLHQQQDALIEKMGQFRVMYRGTLSEQRYLARRARKGGEGATGPYFVWQGTREAQRFGRRVNAREAQRIREGIEARHRFEALCAQYVALGEALAECLEAKNEAMDALKKTPKSPSRRALK